MAKHERGGPRRPSTPQGPLPMDSHGRLIPPNTNKGSKVPYQKRKAKRRGKR